ncbi:hypothetical protein CKY04_24035 [Photorhabdus sp. S8-52]|nr:MULTISPECIES: hypothetical protein [unclassified Photorhabdus]RAW91611.1 hypothetical protein CKY03_23975 [Photorhabdus sp. S9-53]RAW91616.1 hypothetical protein CKY05_23955 [Photorhabdus sp. S10-54]RAW95222.1 hypothetical protein CKY04_24035 [Photorhabdus sp. S8-52]
MPSQYFPDDGKWIQEMLLSLDPSTRGKITVRYAEVYEAAWDEEPVSYRKDNAARRAANIRLREFVRKYARASQGYTEKPLKAPKALPENQPQSEVAG